jgi:hypothetical protein
MERDRENFVRDEPEVLRIFMRRIGLDDDKLEMSGEPRADRSMMLP